MHSYVLQFYESPPSPHPPISQVLCPLKLYFVMNAEENRHLVYIPGFPPAAFDPAVFDPAAFDPAASS